MRYISEQNEHPEIEPQYIIVPESIKADRLDKVLVTLLLKYSRKYLQSYIKNGYIKINGLSTNVKKIVKPYDIISISEREGYNSKAKSVAYVKFDIVSSSSDWIVINKPAGLVTHPGVKNWIGTLSDSLLNQYPELEKINRSGIVHRLDKNTSGLMVVARTENARKHLIKQFQSRTVGRKYLAFVHGRLQKSGFINSPIGRDMRIRTRMSTKKSIFYKTACTHYIPLINGKTEQQDSITKIKCWLETGRTHQVRVHMASLGYPLLGDVLYGGRLIAGAKRQMLHAYALHFEDPGGRGLLSFSAPLPIDMLNIQESINWDNRIS